MKKKIIIIGNRLAVSAFQGFGVPLQSSRSVHAMLLASQFVQLVFAVYTYTSAYTCRIIVTG